MSAGKKTAKPYGTHRRSVQHKVKLDLLKDNLHSMFFTGVLQATGRSKHLYNKRKAAKSRVTQPLCLFCSFSTVGLS